MPAEKPRVLFLCANNSARSQIAEALLRHRAGDRFEALSAGLTPKPVHPLVEPVLREAGLEVPRDLNAKRVGPFLGSRSIRYAIIIGEPDERDCPKIFPFATRTIRWAVHDPEDGATEPIECFRHVRDEIDTRLRDWLDGLDAGRTTTAA
jgi:arsenate reductase (thioredoxin)